jgi:hypothetical protein
VPIILRNNFLMHSDYRSVLVLVLFIQTTGALLFLIKSIKSPINIIKIILYIISIIIFILTLSILVFVLMTTNIGW